jgi:type I restriction enzyme S subunit
VLKDSGVEWLGRIPKHWEVKRLKYLANIRFSNVDKKAVEGEEPVSLCNYVDVYKNDEITNQLQFMEATASEPEIEAFGLQIGDVLITKDSESPDDIAIPAFVRESMGKLLCGYHLAMIRTVNSSLIQGKYIFSLFSFL